MITPKHKLYQAEEIMPTNGSDNTRISGLEHCRPQEDSVVYLRHFPKIELHAHLNGSIRETTLFELAEERGIQLNDRYFNISSSSPSPSGIVDAVDDNRQGLIYNKRHRSLTECFDIFAEIGKVIVDLDAIQRITREALEDFAKESVAYLELRSTPKRLLTKRRRCDGTFSLSSVATEELATKRQYCETVINTLINFRKEEEERYAKELEDVAKSSATSSIASKSGRKLGRFGCKGRVLPPPLDQRRGECWWRQW